MLAVKAVLALDDAGVQGEAQLLGGLHQGVCHLEVRHRRELNGGVLPAGVLIPDGAVGYHHVAGLDVQIDTAAGAGADERVGTAFVELLHSDGSGGTADAGGAGGDLLPQQGAGPDVELPVIRDLLGVVKQGGDGRDPARVTGQDAVAADIPLSTGNVELLCKLLHKITSLCNFQNVCFSVTPVYQISSVSATGDSGSASLCNAGPVRR